MIEEQQPAYYSILPAKVRYDDDLKPMEKILYSEITALCNAKGMCFASNGYFAKLYNTSIRSVSRWITNLARKKYITLRIIYADDTKEIINRQIYIDFPIDKDDVTYRQNFLGGIDKIVKNPIDNIVYNNNTSIKNNTSINIESGKPPRTQIVMPDISDFNEEEQTAIRLWIEYKKERKQAYSQISLNMIIKKIRKEKQDGCNIVQAIEATMAEPKWTGIVYDKGKKITFNTNSKNYNTIKPQKQNFDDVTECTEILKEGDWVKYCDGTYKI